MDILGKGPEKKTKLTSILGAVVGTLACVCPVLTLFMFDWLSSTNKGDVSKTFRTSTWLGLTTTTFGSTYPEGAKARRGNETQWKSECVNYFVGTGLTGEGWKCEYNSDIGRCACPNPHTTNELLLLIDAKAPRVCSSSNPQLMGNKPLYPSSKAMAEAVSMKSRLALGFLITAAIVGLFSSVGGILLIFRMEWTYALIVLAGRLISFGFMGAGSYQGIMYTKSALLVFFCGSSTAFLQNQDQDVTWMGLASWGSILGVALYFLAFALAVGATLMLRANPIVAFGREEERVGMVRRETAHNYGPVSTSVAMK